MEGTLVVKEERNIVDKFKSWYKEKMIDTNASAKLEEGFSMAMKFSKGYNKIIGKIGTVVLTFIPDAAIFAPIVEPICKVKQALLDVEENLVLKGKRMIEAKFIGVDGSSEKVVLPDFDLKQIGEDVKSTINEVKDVVEKESVGKSK